MRRTYIFLTLLLLLIGLLTYFRLNTPPPSPELTSLPIVSPSPLPSITPLPLTLPLPTGLSYSSFNQIFKLNYPHHWAIATASAQPKLPEYDRFTLKPLSDLKNTQFIFTLNQTNTEKLLTCQASDTDCQIQKINQINYRIQGKKISETSATLTYETYVEPYYLKIDGLISGDLLTLETIIKDWEKITQSFKWQVSPTSTSSAQTRFP